jgi:hypothetical protein
MNRRDFERPSATAWKWRRLFDDLVRMLCEYGGVNSVPPASSDLDAAHECWRDLIAAPSSVVS